MSKLAKNYLIFKWILPFQCQRKNCIAAEMNQMNRFIPICRPNTEMNPKEKLNLKLDRIIHQSLLIIKTYSCPKTRLQNRVTYPKINSIPSLSKVGRCCFEHEV